MPLYIIPVHYVLVIHFTRFQKDVLKLRQRRKDQTYGAVLLQGERV